MKPEIKQKWLNALRSGDYQQTQKTLRKGDAFCCLGVLCDLYLNEHSDPKGCWIRSFSDEYQYSHMDIDDDEIVDTEYIPHPVMVWSGIKNENPTVMDKNEVEVSISELNDTGYSFKEIADLIEEKM